MFSSEKDEAYGITCSIQPALAYPGAEEEEPTVPWTGCIMDPQLRNPDTNPSGDENGPAPPSSKDQSQQDGSVVGEANSEHQHDFVRHCPQDPTSQKPISYSMGTIPVEFGERQKRTLGRTLSGQTGGYHVDGYGVPSEPLPTPYGPQYKSYGCTAKEIARSMETTALPRKNPSTYTSDTGMAKSDVGGQVRQAHRPMMHLMPAHGMSRSLPKQSNFPAGEVYYDDCPSHNVVCIQEDLQQRPEAYYTIQPDTRGDYYCKRSLSSTFKPKYTNERFNKQYAVEQQQEMGTQFHKDAEFRKKQRAMAGGYPGDQHWIYDERQQGQRYAVHVVQESGRSDSFHEGGDTGIVKSSGDSSFKSFTVPADLSNRFVYVRDAMTGDDTPLPPSVTGVSTVKPDAVLNGEAEDELLTPCSSTASAGSSDSESESKAESEHKSRSEPESNTALNVTYANKPYDEAASDVSLPEIHSTVQQPHEQELRTFLQNPLQHPLQEQYSRHSMPIPSEYAHRQGAYQKYVQKYYMGKAYRQPYQPAQWMMNYQQGHTNPGTGQGERGAYAAPKNVGSDQVPLRMPAEASSLRSFPSQSSTNIWSGETGEDRRSLQSRSNMRIPLIRSTIPSRGTGGDKSRMSYLFNAFNVIVFSVLAGMVAAFIIQQLVSH